MRLDMEPAPLMLGFILGPMLEENFRRAMLLSRGSFVAFVERPISATLLGVIAMVVMWQVWGAMRKGRGSAVATTTEAVAPANG
jgi:TctA family transporter